MDSAVAPPSSTFHQIAPPKYLDQNMMEKLPKTESFGRRNITIILSFLVWIGKVSVGDVQTYDRR